MLRRCGSALAEVLQGRADPLGLLFSDEGPSAADLYREAPAAQAANRMLGEIVAAAVSDLSHERRLRSPLQGLPGETPLRGVVYLMESGRERGAQVLDQDLATGPAGKRLGQLSGSPLWGIGKVVPRAAAWPLVSLEERSRKESPGAA